MNKKNNFSQNKKIFFCKKGMEREAIITLILALIIITGVIFYAKYYTEFAKGSANKQAVNTWVNLQGLKKDVTGPLSESARPPVPYLDEPLEIEKEDLEYNGGDYPKAFEEIAGSMYDCWDAFNKGKTDFMNSISKETFCYPCRTIKFSNDVKLNGPQIIGFNNFINSNKPVAGENNPTYYQLLANDKEAKLDTDEVSANIETNQDLYIMFFAASGRSWGNIISNVLGFGDILEENTDLSKAPVQTETSEDIRGERALGAAAVGGTALVGAKALNLVRGVGEVTEKTSELASVFLEEGIKVIDAGELQGLNSVEEATAKIAQQEKNLESLKKQAKTLSDQLSKTPKNTNLKLTLQNANRDIKKLELELPKLKKAGAALKELETGLALKSETIITKEGIKKAILTPNKATKELLEKTGEKVVNKAVKKGLLKSGVKLVASKILIVATVATGLYGTYEVIWGDKPFIATVMITDPEKIIPLCNEEPIRKSEEQIKIDEDLNDAMGRAYSGY